MPKKSTQITVIAGQLQPLKSDGFLLLFHGIGYIFIIYLSISYLLIHLFNYLLLFLFCYTLFCFIFILLKNFFLFQRFHASYKNYNTKTVY